MKFASTITIVLILSLLNMGCPSSHIGVTYRTDRPVLLGKVMKINGAVTQPDAGKAHFDIPHNSAGLLIWAMKGGPETYFQDSNDADDELKKNIHAPDNVIRADAVYFGSLFIGLTVILAGFAYYESSVGIECAVYDGKIIGQADNGL